MKYVTLIATDQITPYNKGDVFTVTEKEAEMLLHPTGVDNEGKPLVLKVVKYDPKKAEHVALLEAQRGKPADQDTEPGAAPDSKKPVFDADAVKAEVLNSVKDQADKIVADAIASAQKQADKIVQDAKDQAAELAKPKDDEKPKDDPKK